MKNLIVLLASLFYTTLSFGQSELPVFEAEIQYSPDLSIKTQNEIERQSELLNMDELSDAEKEELDQLLLDYGEVVESVWDVVDGGCSWYCGGGNYKISASSELVSKTDISYAAESANDLRYDTAWVEGKEDGGIGEYLEYTFTNDSPRITSIIIANGYMKSESAWRNNNRVKSLKLFINGKAHGILKLEDLIANSEFKLGTLGHNEDGSDLVLRFEIMEVYRGEKHNDTAITEIFFDGIDVH